jgi:uncharacterized protein (DUF169 family)
MKSIQTDFSIYEKFNFERPPIGVKFLFFRPEGIPALSSEKSLSLCEMMVEAQRSRKAFYFNREYAETCVGKILLGMQDMEPFAESGQIGERLGVFQEARANYALYKHVPKFQKNTVQHMVFAPIDQLTFEPDLLILAADPGQAEIVLRAMTYSTGELYSSITTPVMGCAWVFIYPFQSGKVNFILPEFVHGMKGRELFPKNSVLLSIPYHWIPTLTRNLGEMTWHLPSHQNRKQYLAEFQTILADLSRESHST